MRESMIENERHYILTGHYKSGQVHVSSQMMPICSSITLTCIMTMRLLNRWPLAIFKAVFFASDWCISKPVQCIIKPTQMRNGTEQVRYMGEREGRRFTWCPLCLADFFSLLAPSGKLHMKSSGWNMKGETARKQFMSVWTHSVNDRRLLCHDWEACR